MLHLPNRGNYSRLSGITFGSESLTLFTALLLKCCSCLRCSSKQLPSKHPALLPQSASRALATIYRSRRRSSEAFKFSSIVQNDEQERACMCREYCNAAIVWTLVVIGVRHRDPCCSYGRVSSLWMCFFMLLCVPLSTHSAAAFRG